MQAYKACKCCVITQPLNVKINFTFLLNVYVSAILMLYV